VHKSWFDRNREDIMKLIKERRDARKNWILSRLSHH
jgi:hypothetical protein